ncbi:GtrA family protein [Marinibacterium profundimaris]|uniref:Polysaccharide biosynthesis protein GtrA n=1 Tax=Marinibacterium profundimaris TaxID=1679460 RepID=A0A225NR69_9RHOB|nr:GtrA family protein [Marinibacterium profundimaris]OWU77349.1 polysaccharide biosynthesis protein GtrA [Marinibacterium profundimaris]
MARAEIARLLRFALVGGTVAAFYVALFALLRAQGMAEGPANTIAFAAAICLQYVGQTRLTFRRPLAGLGQMSRFGLTVGLGYAVSLLVTGVIGPALGWADWQSAAVVAVLLPLQNFTIFRLWVYTGAPA